jgi:hypothetical protein
LTDGHPGAALLVRRKGEVLGALVAPACTLLDLDAVVLEAAMGVAAPPFVLGLRHAIEVGCPPEVGGHVQVLAGELPDAECRGGLALAVRRFVAGDGGEPALRPSAGLRALTASAPHEHSGGLCNPRR